MKVKEYSKIANMYTDPKNSLESLFPTFRECEKCHSMITLETLKDVRHATYTHEHAAYRKDWLEWICPVCKRHNQFTNEEPLVNAHRRIVRSGHDIAEYVMVAIAVMFVLFFCLSPLLI